MPLVSALTRGTWQVHFVRSLLCALMPHGRSDLPMVQQGLWWKQGSGDENGITTEGKSHFNQVVQSIISKIRSTSNLWSQVIYARVS
jgi:hypothetical protein